MSKQIKKKNKV